MLHTMIVFGTRPEGIKMMPVIRALRTIGIEVTIVVTGQHREMLQQVFSAFGEHPDLDLDIMTADQTLSQVTANVLTRLTQILASHRPDLMLVHGDTTTAMAAAVAAFYAHVPVGHVEAGLRSFDLNRPWPEEFNRVSIDSHARLLFAPTETARQNLLSEYNRTAKIFVTGNTGIDAVLQVAESLSTDRGLFRQLTDRYSFLDSNRHLILVTGHRRESFGEGFERICQGLRLVAERPDVQVLYPVHLNPKVRGIVLDRLADLSNVVLIDPVEYMDMVFLMQRASILITDSGGIQEEGPALGRPVLVMRDVTERPEALSTGVVKLIGTNPVLMRSEVDDLLDRSETYKARAQAVFPYGDGTAATQIAQIVAKEFMPLMKSIKMSGEDSYRWMKEGARVTSRLPLH